MKKRTVLLMRATIVMFILVLIPYVQNAADGPTVSGINIFMGYYTSNSFPTAYLYIITLGMIRGVILTLFIQTLLNDLKESEPTKFDLNK